MINPVVPRINIKKAVQKQGQRFESRSPVKSSNKKVEPVMSRNYQSSKMIKLKNKISASIVYISSSNIGGGGGGAPEISNPTDQTEV